MQTSCGRALQRVHGRGGHGRSAAVILQIFIPYAEVVEEGILPLDRSGHSEYLHNVSHDPMCRTTANSQGVQDPTGKGAVDGHS